MTSFPFGAMDSEAVVAVACVLVCAFGLLVDVDGRSMRAQNKAVYTVRTNFFKRNDDLRQDDASFRSAFRVGRGCFEAIVAFVEAKWPIYHKGNPNSVGKNRKFFLREKVALVLFYLGSRGSLKDACQTFGVSKSTGSRALTRIIHILYSERERIIFYPRNACEWSEVALGFENVCGIPNVAGAVDGTLIKRSRPAAFWGWYCRKGFPAYNVMAITDANQRFMAFSVRPGSCNDQSVWNRSLLGTNVKQRLPLGMHFIADAGYALRSYMLTPFAHEDRGNPVINKFNKAHSRTRIAVEMAFGALKGRFQILRREIDMNSDVEDGKVIAGCFVLHNFALSHEQNALDELATVVAGEAYNSMTDEMVQHDSAYSGSSDGFHVEEDAAEELLTGQSKRNEIVSLLVEAVTI